MISGNSTLPPSYGHGWGEAMSSTSPESTERWEQLLTVTSLEAALALRAGLTAMAISGSLGARRTAFTTTFSAIFGNSILPPGYGHGWGEANSSTRPESTGR